MTTGLHIIHHTKKFIDITYGEKKNNNSEDDSIKQPKSYFFWSHCKIKSRWYVHITNSELVIKLYLKSLMFVTIKSEQIFSPKKLLIISFSTKTWADFFRSCLFVRETLWEI